MAFVASQQITLGAGVQTALPLMIDVAGNTNAHLYHTHAAVPGGTTYTFDSGQSWNIPASTPTIIPLPAAAQYVTAVAASWMQVGKNMD